jgi:hypothetical protein
MRALAPGHRTAEVVEPGRRSVEVLLLVLTRLLPSMGIWTGPSRVALERALRRREPMLALAPVGGWHRVAGVRREGSG